MRRVAAVAMARWAQGQVPLYKDLYHGLPPVTTWRDFRRLPVLTAERWRATAATAQLDEVADTLRTFTPLLLATEPPAPPTIADADDIDDWYDKARDAMRLLGLRRGARLVLLTDPEQRYYAAELADQLGYWGAAAHLLIVRPGAALIRTVAALAPDQIIGLSRAAPTALRPSITVRQPAAPGADCYVVPEAGLVAVRPTATAPYRVLAGHALLERDRDGRLLLTALRRHHQPLIRYRLPDRGRVRGNDLWLDEVAP